MSRGLVLSLDFELRWGVYDAIGDDPHAYRKNLDGVRDAVPRLLELFARTRTRATWAMVGAVACASWDEYRARAPAWPAYRDPSLAFPRGAERFDPEGRLHFAPDLAALIVAAEGQELGSHTFSHLYFAEPGCTAHDVEADAAAMARLFEERFHAAPSSFVFPRNQVAFVTELRNANIRTWRDNPSSWYWAARPGRTASPPVRLARICDALLPVAHRRSRRSAAQKASFFVRLGLPEPLWRQHLRRIAAEARTLPDENALHLWWHPHNLGADPVRGARRVAEMLETVHDTRAGALRSQTMDEWATG